MNGVRTALIHAKRAVARGLRRVDGFPTDNGWARLAALLNATDSIVVLAIFDVEVTSTRVRGKPPALDAAPSLVALRAVPGYRLESLKGDRQGQFSIRINDQWRVCFRWEADGAHDVEIVDYH